MDPLSDSTQGCPLSAFPDAFCQACIVALHCSGSTARFEAKLLPYCKGNRDLALAGNRRNHPCTGKRPQ